MTPKIIQIAATETLLIVLLEDGTLRATRHSDGAVQWETLPLPPPCTQQTPAPSEVHNPENVPEDKLPPGRRFMTVEEQAQRVAKNGGLQNDLWMWREKGWDASSWNGQSSRITYCVPNDFTP